MIVRCLFLFALCSLTTIVTVHSTPVTFPVDDDALTNIESLKQKIDMARTVDGQDECIIDTAIRDTCESCSKVTKSVIVYPFCCKAKLGIRNWCVEFLNYSLKESQNNRYN
uniref:Venom protein n=1 Tax=Centruroides hentzi TaxID=88313 RepID=A0A2I9LPY6_9SCOR